MCLSENVFGLLIKRVCALTGLSGPAVDRLAPGPGADAVDGLNSDLVLGPLLQVLDGELPLQPVHDDVRQDPPFGPGFGVLHPVADEIWIPVVLPLWKRLRGFFCCCCCFYSPSSRKININDIITERIVKQ